MVEVSPGATTSGRKRNWLWELTALSIALVGVVVRCLPWRYVFSGAGVVMADPDSYYHLWRAQILVDSFPAAPAFDAFISFPFGAPVPWPPGFGLLLAAPGLMGAPASTTAVWGALLMPLLGGAAVYLTYRLGRRVFDPATGLAAAALMSLMGGAVEYSALGRVDHHGLVAPVTLGMFLALLRSLGADSARRAAAWGIACGLLAAVSVGSWIVTPPLYFLPIPVTILLLRWSPRADSARRASWWCLGSATGLVLATVLLAGDLQARPFDLYHPSWFTVDLFGLGAAAVAAAHTRRFTWPLLGAVAGLAVLLPVLAPGLWDSLQEGLRVAVGVDPSYGMASEARGLLSEHGRFSLDLAVARYSHLVLLVPVFWGWAFWRQVKSGHFEGGSVLFLAFSSMGICLLLIQHRFAEYAAPALALLFGWALVEGARKFWAYSQSASSRARAVVLAVCLLAAVCAAVHPLAAGVVDRLRRDSLAYHRHLLSFGREIAARLPRSTGADGRPDWGAIAGWNDSLPLLYLTGLPVMVSSFGTREAFDANRLAFGILLSRDEERAYRQMAEHRIRFVVTSSFVTQIVSMAEIAGVPEPYARVEIKEQNGHFYKQFTPLALFFECILARMFLCDGSEEITSGMRCQALSHLRLTMESRASYRFAGSEVALFKVFEAVPGARLAGKAAPGQVVWLRLSLQTNTGRQLVFQSGTTAGPDGRFEIIIPYPTEPWGAPVTPLGTVRVKIGEDVYRVEVSEEDVRQGRSVVVI